MFESKEKQKQCLICYEQEILVSKQVCQNLHKICQKCLFSLRKRQCPICKKSFRIKMINRSNRHAYQIIFNQEDKQHDKIAVEEDVRQQQQVLRRHYGIYGVIYDYHNNFHNSYGNEANNYYPHYVFSQRNGYFTQNHQNIQEVYNLGSNVQGQQYQQGTQYQANDQQWHDIYMREPNYRQSHNQNMRILRRNRNQEMYNREIRLHPYTQQAITKQYNCSLLGKIGQFFIDIGKKLKGERKPQTQRVNQSVEDQNERGRIIGTSQQRQILRNLGRPTYNANDHHNYGHDRQYHQPGCIHNNNQSHYCQFHNNSNQLGHIPYGTIYSTNPPIIPAYSQMNSHPFRTISIDNQTCF